eukprot:TRINITY_DN5841_c0_g1_i1.p1 TRINITY_DN5841_c0_g1~~TRINITY_DN5841_c0_g1_i1.p1  ORF type:complete len:203 (+),score=31.71 TRINITY_DN5841_c0_g1_i1:53-661(+)
MPRVSILLSLLAATALASQADVEVALHSDDQCASGDSDCALNALQARSLRNTEVEPADTDEEDEEELDSELLKEKLGALVPDKDLRGCGGHEYLHGDWKSKHLMKQQVHITTGHDTPHHCTLGGHGNKYTFGWPHARPDKGAGARVFPICHSVDKATWRSDKPCGDGKNKYEECHVLINGGSGCSAEQVIKKLNSAKWERDH